MGEDGRVEVQVDKVNLSDGRVSSVSPMSFPRYAFSAVVSAGCILVFGGYNARSWCEIIDPTRDKWVYLPDMPTGRHVSAVVHLTRLRDLGVGGKDK